MTDEGAVLVTGGAGYVGSATAHALRRAGRRFVVLDDLSTGHRSFVRWSDLVEGDVGDGALVGRVIERYGVTAILHFAAKALVGESVREPELYDAWNRGKTTALIEAASRAGVRHFVFSSSCAVYGDPVETPIPESHPREPVNPYGESKRACEDVLFHSDMNGTALRYFNACGGLPDQGVGERHQPETHLIPLAVRAARTGAPLTVFGSDYDTPDGTCVRDYVHVADLATAHLAALERMEQGRGGGAWNLGTGRGVSVREILTAVGDALGVPVPTRDGPRRPGDPPVLVAQTTRAREDLGWRAACSGLDRIVRDAAAYDERPWSGSSRPLP